MHTFGIIGPGAVGAVIAETLQDSGYDVTLLGRKTGKVQIKRAGISASTILPVKALSQTLTAFDYLFIAVKGTQLEGILPFLPQVTDKKSICILCQNGHGQLERFTLPNTYQAVVYISGQKKEQVVTHFRDRTLILPKNDATTMLQQAIADSKLDLQLHDQYLYDLWYKLLVNLAINSVTALSRNTAIILKEAKVRQLCRKLLHEGITIAAAEGIDFEEDIIEEIMQIYDGYPPYMGTSMYYDIMNQQPLETTYIQGYLYQRSQAHSLDTPCLDTVYSLLVASEIKNEKD
ncbi:oxidoreductase [Gracilibacillus alcaliphilus]|uniref:oxidoreductase n=1 Tax=Gracilibacillus alcaliphilus TaxID=1401441 RepID=UPI00195DE290|nr:oxidoreductase [Gracilibacillus alcaliphilus]